MHLYRSMRRYEPDTGSRHFDKFGVASIPAPTRHFGKFGIRPPKNTPGAGITYRTYPRVLVVYEMPSTVSAHEKGPCICGQNGLAHVSHPASKSTCAASRWPPITARSRGDASWLVPSVLRHTLRSVSPPAATSTRMTSARP